VVELAEFLPFDAALRGRLGRPRRVGLWKTAYFSWTCEWGTGRPLCGEGAIFRRGGATMACFPVSWL